MKVSALVVLGVVACGGTGPAQRAAGPGAEARPVRADNKEMLAVMERYLATGTGVDPGDLDRIRDFVEKSPDVLVEIDLVVAPFIEEDLDDGVKKLLLIGYVAGNAASQLRTGVKRSDQVAGVEGELAIYLILKANATTALKDVKVVSPRLDAWLELRARGELRDHLARAGAGRARSKEALGSAASTAPAPRRAPGDADGKQREQVLEAMRLVRDGKPQEAITDHLDKVIASYETQYANEKRHIYCAHTQAETLKYMFDAAKRHEDAIALDPTWAEAWFVKAYALTELHRLVDARLALEEAIALSPSYPQYLSEKGYLHQRDRNWSLALQAFREAESSVKLLVDQRQQLVERTRALRGQGYALVELGDLDGAERVYRQSLALDPDDTQSRKELEDIQIRRHERK